MHEIKSGKIVNTTKIISGEFARNAIRRMGQAAMQIQLNGLDPNRLKHMEVMPSVNAQL